MLCASRARQGHFHHKTPAVAHLARQGRRAAPPPTAFAPRAPLVSFPTAALILALLARPASTSTTLFKSAPGTHAGPPLLRTCSAQGHSTSARTARPASTRTRLAPARARAALLAKHNTLPAQRPATTARRASTQPPAAPCARRAPRASRALPPAAWMQRPIAANVQLASPQLLEPLLAMSALLELSPVMSLATASCALPELSAALAPAPAPHVRRANTLMWAAPPARAAPTASILAQQQMVFRMTRVQNASRASSRLRARPQTANRAARASSSPCTARQCACPALLASFRPPPA